MDDREGPGITPGPLLALRADPAVRAVVLGLELGEAFTVVTVYVSWPGRPERSGIRDYLAPLLLHHFAILVQ